MQDLAFGLFDWIDAAPGRSVGEVYEDRLRLLVEADRGEFAVYHLPEHPGAPLGLSPSPAVFLAAAARETTRIRLAPTTFIVPLYDPLRPVEEIGMLAQLTRGRVGVRGDGRARPAGGGPGGDRGRQGILAARGRDVRADAAADGGAVRGADAGD